MMQDLLFGMINDGRRFGMKFISGLPSHFGMKGDVRHFGRGDDNHFEKEFRFILDFLLDLWLIFSE